MAKTSFGKTCIQVICCPECRVRINVSTCLENANTINPAVHRSGDRWAGRRPRAHTAAGMQRRCQTDTRSHREVSVQVAPRPAMRLLQVDGTAPRGGRGGVGDSEAERSSHVSTHQIVIRWHEAPTPCAHCREDQESRGKMLPAPGACGLEQRQMLSKK